MKNYNVFNEKKIANEKELGEILIKDFGFNSAILGGKGSYYGDRKVISINVGLVYDVDQWIDLGLNLTFEEMLQEIEKYADFDNITKYMQIVEESISLEYRDIYNLFDFIPTNCELQRVKDMKRDLYFLKCAMEIIGGVRTLD